MDPDKDPRSKDYSRQRRHGSWDPDTHSNRSQLVERTVQTILDAVDGVIQTHRYKRGSRHALHNEVEYKKMVRKLDHYERKYEKRKKSAIVYAIITGATFIFDPFGGALAIPTIFASLAGINFYTAHDTKKKLNTLWEERRLYEQRYFPDAEVSTEKRILHHAQRQNGKVFPEAVALDSEFSLDEIERVLSICVDKHIATIELDERGRTYYYFSTFDNENPYENLD